MKTNKNIHVGSRTYIPPETIVMIQSEINYSLIYLIDGQKFIVSTCLKKLEERFAVIQSFARVHKSFLVNLDYLKSYNEGHFLLENNLTCIVSRRKFRRLKEEKRVNLLQ
ncbi:LytR/AlgR family response regulator transcription factor [Emticicia sp. SJ17W-69]|uniref:LytR/AlgR family response regulator transcription factor n=1 Tax=Emticicia sp. SJ17W-69 TaxID=3421657 RepID=UPI003EBEEF02